MKYLAETGKTWIYPYLSHATNFSEVGTHNPSRTALHQVALDDVSRQYRLPPSDELIAYDIFYERIWEQIEDSTDRPLIMDMYGTRVSVTGPAQLATSRRLARKPIGTYGLALRPHENNNLSISGDDVRVYEIASGETIMLTAGRREPAWGYYVNAGWREALKIAVSGLASAIRRRLPVWHR